MAATPTPLPPSEPPSSSWVYLLGGILHESHRVISSHTRHFLALSVLFLLPLSLLLLSSPHLLLLSLSSSSSSSSPPTPPQSLLRLPHPSSSHSSSAAISLSLSAAAVVLLSLSASAAVSLSFRRSLFSLPVNLLPLLLSLPLPFLRLLLTLLPFLLLFFSLSLPLLFFSPFSLPLLLLLPFLLLPFSLSFPISVLESSHFLSPLRRSLYLTRTMRLPSLCLLLFFLPALPLLVWAFGLHRTGPEAGWNVARTVFGSAALTVLLLYWFATNAALYVYCKAVHGELAEEVADEFLYVCLPSDPDKVPHVVSVVRQ